MMQDNEVRLPDEPRGFSGWLQRNRRSLATLLPISVSAVAFWALQHAARTTSYRDLQVGLRAVPHPALAVAAGLALASYVTLALLEALSLHYAGASISARRTALVSLCASALGHALGFPLLTASAVRYRLYTAWGLEARAIGMVIGFGAFTFWTGLVAATAILLLAGGGGIAVALHVSAATAIVGSVLCSAAIAGYVALAIVRPAGVRIRSTTVVPPPPLLALGQIGLSISDWALAGSILYALLPEHAVPFTVVLGVFVLAQIAGMLSHVPAGLGVVETAVVALLSPWLPAGPVLVALVAYRAIYYVVPLLLACGLLAGRELTSHGDAIGTAARAAGGYAPILLPAALAVAVFIAGVVLTVSGATPPIHSRVQWLHRVSPAPVMEGAYFLASLIGTAMMFVARGVSRRMDGAWAVAVVLLAAGAVMSLLKGLDYEEAALLLGVLTVLVAARRSFRRRSALLSLDFSPSWIVAIVVVLGGSVWLVFFSHRQLLSPGDPWWHFAFANDGPQSLRATLGAVILASAAAIARLVRPARPHTLRPGPAEIARAAKIAAVAPSTMAHLALVGDKALLFNEADTAFLMYGVIGQSWVAMGAPVGPPADCVALAWRFRELAHEHGGRAIFYLVSPSDLPLYVDLGMTLFKLGESARVSLSDFTLDGGGRKWLRRARKHALDAGCTFEVVAADAIADVVPDLRRVSDAWLAARNTREKGFSLGFFDEPYVRRLPVAVVRQGGRIVAFANLWPGGEGEELSVDLVRYSGEATTGVVDYLFCELLLWGKTAGFRWFDLGMAPLSGLGGGRLAPLWNRLGGQLYLRGEAFYNFQGLRRFKEKFDPVWEPRYLATTGRASVPMVLGQVTALISRGLRGAVVK